jgi:hypothetical protein
MKRNVFVLSLVLILALSSVVAFADEITVNVNIDSTKVEFNEDLGFPFIDENNRTQVPFRATLEKYGAQVEWNNESRVAIATKGEIVVEIPIDENYIIKNGEKITVDTSARIVNGRTYLPIRPVIVAFGSDVQWDSKLNTVVLTTEPVDAEAIYFTANEKSYNWDNYDMKATINMSIDVPDDAGSVQTQELDMNMDMTIFMNPLRAKVKAAMPITVMGTETLQPIMDIYMTIGEKGLTQYMGMLDEKGEFSWIKQTIENELFADLIKNDIETIKKNDELTRKYTEDVKYFGKYTEDGKTLLRLQYTMSGDIYKEMFGQYSEIMPEPATEQEAMAAEMMKSLATIDLGDLTYIIYIDEATGEMVKMEMDLGDMIAAIMPAVTGMLGEEMPPEAIEIFKSIKANMVTEILNINSAEDFEIPEEALNAQDINEMLKELQQLETETEVEAGIQEEL